jgi:hypothetical protein
MGVDSSQIFDAIDGGIGASHPKRAPLTLLAASATANEFNTLHARIFPLACWRVEDLRFEFDSSFVLPEIVQELTQLIRLINEHTIKNSPDGKTGEPLRPALSIFGHADPVGNDDYNKQLSGRRAQAIYGLLTRKTALWEELFSNPIGGDKWGDPAIATMRATTGQTASGPTTPASRKQLFADYMEKICVDENEAPFVIEPKDFLGGGRDNRGKADFQGCSEFNPVLMFSRQEAEKFERSQDKTARNAANKTNRRVLAFLFRPGIKIDPAAWPCPRVKEGTAACKKRFWSDADKRRQFQESRREFRQDGDTFACRLYTRLANNSPCERLLRDPLEVSVFVGPIDDDLENETLDVLDSTKKVTRSFKPKERNKDSGFRHFIIGPGALPNPVELRWRMDEFDIHVAGPCDPIKLRDALATIDLETGQKLISVERKADQPAPRVVVNDDLGNEDDQTFGPEANRTILT